MSFRVHREISNDDLRLLSGPYYDESLRSGLEGSSTTVHPRLYFSYNSMTQQTIFTTDLNRSHLRMIQHLKELSGGSIQQEEIGRLITQCFVVIQDFFRLIAESWDVKATGEVCSIKFRLRLY